MARMISRTTPMPRLQPISFFSTGSNGSTCALRNSSPTFTCDTFLLLRSAGQRRLDAAEEQPGNQQPDPDHKTEQAHEIHRGETANALLPELLEVGEHTDREEGQDEEYDAQRIGFAHRRRHLRRDVRWRRKREI